MTKVKFVLYFISNRLLCSFVIHTLIYETFELYVFEKIEFIG